MTGKVIVCNWCNGDCLGECGVVSSKRGFTAYCFDCDEACTTLEVPIASVKKSNHMDWNVKNEECLI